MDSTSSRRSRNRRGSADDSDSGWMITPMIDVSFLLLMAIVVQRVITGAVPVRLPVVRRDDIHIARPSTEKPPTSVFSITSDGTVVTQGQALAGAPALDSALRATASAGKRVLLVCDRDAPVRAYCQFALAYAKHFTNDFSLCVKPEPDLSSGSQSCPKTTGGNAQ